MLLPPPCPVSEDERAVQAGHVDNTVNYSDFFLSLRLTLNFRQNY
jgi:hypothetical protein